MIRTFTFTKTDAKKFEMLYSGFLAGGNALHQTAAPKRDERIKERSILRALKAISEETNAETRTRKLHAAGGAVTLEQADHELLLKYLEAAPFATVVSDELADLLDWVSAADKTEPLAAQP